MGQMITSKPLIIIIWTCQMSRDDDKDKDKIDWLYGCCLVGFGLVSWAVGQITAVKPQPQI
jgi:hypothetical protein